MRKKSFLKPFRSKKKAWQVLRVTFQNQNKKIFQSFEEIKTNDYKFNFNLYEII
jgi:hypothetical protein